jgi:hypothetical protein
MAILFADGFDHYQIGILAAKGYSVISTTGTPAMVAGRLGQQALRMTQNTTARTVYSHGLAAAAATCVIGSAYRTDSITVTKDVLTLSVAGANTLRLGINTSGLLIVRNSAGTVLATGTTILSTSTWHYVEMRGFVNGASGEVQVWLNGAVEIATTTVSIGSTNFDTFILGPNVNTSINNCDYDDLYVLDTSGSANTAALGDVRVESLYPTADGVNTQWTPNSGSPHFSRVNEAATTFPDGDTSYVSDSTSGHVDEYDFGAVAVAAGTPFAVLTNIYARKDDAGTRQIADVIRQSGVDNAGASKGVPVSYTYVQTVHDKDPAGAAWTLSTIPGGGSGVQVGVKDI